MENILLSKVYCLPKPQIFRIIALSDSLKMGIKRINVCVKEP